MISKQRDFKKGICWCYLFSFLIAAKRSFFGNGAPKLWYNLITTDNRHSVLISTASHDKENVLPGLAVKDFLKGFP